MPEQPRPMKIVVAVDPRSLDPLSTDAALELVGRRPNAEIHIVSAAEHGWGPDLSGTGAAVTALEGLFTQRLVARGLEERPKSFVHLRVGHAAAEVLRFASEIDADLIVVGTHDRRSVQRFLLGSVSSRIAETAPCPVLIARPRAVDLLPHPEPACEACVKVREQTEGASWWCEDHDRPTERPHTYAYSSLLDRQVPPHAKLW